jgi:two-component system probable response regulator PhcQ
MEEQYDYKKFAILYVDDEERSLRNFTRAFEDQFRIFTAASAPLGLRLLEEKVGDIGVLITDQRMPGEKGVWLLERARQLQPRIIRMLTTAYADMDAAITAVNSGAIYKYITKPWDPPGLAATLKRSLEFFLVQRERDQLLEEKISVLRHIMIADRMVSLGLLAAGLSHHIRNALVAVKTFLDLAPLKLQEEKVELATLRHPDFWREYYQNVQTQVQKINAMLKDLGNASEPPAFAFDEQVTLAETLDQVLGQLRGQFAAKNIRVDNHVPRDLPPLHVDKPRFFRLFELLFKDELVTLPQGSVVSIAARLLPEPEAAGRALEIKIHDNGPGLPQEALRLIFDPFVVRSDSPLEYGLNLMACFFIVHHHGGQITATNGDGQGTTFVLRLATHPNQALAAAESQDLFQKIMANNTLWEKLLAGH